MSASSTGATPKAETLPSVPAAASPFPTKFDAPFIVGGLILLAGIAWFKTIHDVQGMSCVMMMPAMHGPWWQGCPAYVVAWAVMMAAMMLPAASPVVLLYARSMRQNRSYSPSMMGILPWLFVAGYLIVWGSFGIPAYFATLWIQAYASNHQSVAALGPAIGGATILAAGVYQWTPLKESCLRHCRSPLHFLMRGWKKGPLGAVQMGVEHGAVCGGCCIGLMLVLFVLGIMNLMWMAIVAALMSAEKLLPWGRAASRTVGAVMIAAGTGIMLLPSVQKLLFG